MTIYQYKDKHRDPVTGQEPPVGYVVGKSVDKPIKPAVQDRFTLLFSQAEEDPALVPTIKSIVENEERIAQFQEQLKDLSSPKSFQGNINLIKQLNTVIKDLQNTNLSLMDSMNLTRKSKKLNKESPQSTPSKFVTAIEEFSKVFTVDQWERMQRDISDSERRVKKNLKTLQESTETEIGTTENATGEDTW